MGRNSVEYWHNILSSDRSDSELDHPTSEADGWGSEPLNLVAGAQWGDTRADIWVPYKYHRDSEFDRCPSEHDWPPRLNHRSARPAFRRLTRMGRPSTYVFDSYGDTCITLHTSKDRTFSFSGDTLSNVPSNEVSRSEFNVSSDWGEVAHEDCDAASVESLDSRHKYHEYGEIPGSSPGQVEIRVLVSGKHLELGSDYFTELFSSPRAGQLIGDSGLYEIQARGWDPVAHQTVLSILHGYSKDVPKSPSIELLAEITMVVNYYGCHESVEPHARLWLQNLWHKLPEKYGIDCILSMAISWVFDDQDIFHQMARLALRNSSGLITVEDDRLPIPDGLFEMINASRERYLESVSSAIARLFHRLREEDDCRHACASLMLGRLTKKIYKFECNDLGSQALLAGLSIEGCLREIESMGVPDGWNPCRHPSTVYERLHPELEDAENQLPDFHLKGRMPTAKPEPNPYVRNKDNW